MNIILKTFLLVLFSFSLSSADVKEETYIKIGVFDYSHQTDMFALNRKKVTDKVVKSDYLGELTQVYDLMILGDVNESFTHNNDNKIKNREEYAFYISTGLQKKFNPSSGIYIVPSFSVGLYNEFNKGKDMGLPLEFKSEIEFNFQANNNLIFGVTYNHISNADLGSTNPGSDSILIGFRYKTN